MRRSEVDTNWRRLRLRSSHSLIVKEIQVEGVQGFRDAVIPVGQPIFAICGQNGSGKTVLLRAIMATLGWREVAQRQQFAQRLNGALLRVKVERRGSTAEDIVLDWRNGQGPVGDEGIRSILFFDSAQEVPRIQRFFQELQDLEEVIGAYGETELNAAAVRSLSYVTQKQYERIRVTEIDDIESIEGVPAGVVPFFRLTEQGVDYDTRTTSLGELAVLTIYWKLITCDAGALILLEEPETFLSEISQKELLDLIVGQAAAHDLTVIYSTHSPRLVRNLADHEVTFLYRSTEGVKVAPDEVRSNTKRALGYDDHVSKIVVVEDSFAQCFFRSICERLDPELLADVEVAGRGGRQTLDKLREAFPEGLTGVKIAFLYDGDMAHTLDGTNALALPGGASPEKTLRDYITANVAQVAERINVPSAALEIRLAQLNGRDDHDWLPELAQFYGHNLDAFTRLIIDPWLSDQANLTTATALLSRLKEVLSR